MELIGLLDSPYVRRVAISFRLLDLTFTLRRLSVFADAEAFRTYNPVIKAPTLICRDGQRLMDSGLILEYGEHLTLGRSLMPLPPASRVTTLGRIGLALAVCEKAVQLVMERELRPADKRHAPWQTRVEGQLRAACGALDKSLLGPWPPLDEATLGQDVVSTAVAWSFVHHILPGLIERRHYPTLDALTTQAEALSVFRDYPLS